MFLSLQAMICYLAAEIKMFKEKCHACIEEVEKTTFNTLIVNKLILSVPTK